MSFSHLWCQLQAGKKRCNKPGSAQTPKHQINIFCSIFGFFFFFLINKASKNNPAPSWEMFPQQLLLNLGFFNRNKQTFSALLLCWARVGGWFTGNSRLNLERNQMNPRKIKVGMTSAHGATNCSIQGRRNQLRWTLLLSVARVDPKNLLQPEEKFLWVSKRTWKNCLAMQET